MEEILQQLGCKKPCKYWDKLPGNYLSSGWQDFFHQEYVSAPP